MDTKDNSDGNEHLEEQREEPADGRSDGTNQDEEYSFLSETVKKRPVSMRKVLYKILCIAGAAVLFGVIAALV